MAGATLEPTTSGSSVALTALLSASTSLAEAASVIDNSASATTAAGQEPKLDSAVFNELSVISCMTGGDGATTHDPTTLLNAGAGLYLPFFSQ
jgi:hypothetical protein